MKKVGILGGSFDPIHLGHLNLATSLKQLCRLDEVIFVPAFCSPFKGDSPPQASPEDRLKMVALAIADVPEFALIDWEIHAKTPSYTIDTVRRLSKDRTLQLHLLLGDDQVADFSLWKEAEELVRLSPPLIGTRLGKEVNFPIPGSKSVKIPIFEASSTQIRERLSKKLPCEHLLPASVLDYIRKHQLYSSTF
jgi:nicotinate-nucleotide adenylyltransferase